MYSQVPSVSSTWVSASIILISGSPSSGELTHSAANFHDCILPQTTIKKSAAYVSSFLQNVAIVDSGFRLALAVASLARMTRKNNIQKSSAGFWKDQR